MARRMADLPADLAASRSSDDGAAARRVRLAVEFWAVVRGFSLGERILATRPGDGPVVTAPLYAMTEKLAVVSCTSHAPAAVTLSAATTALPGSTRRSRASGAARSGRAISPRDGREERLVRRDVRAGPHRAPTRYATPRRDPSPRSDRGGRGDGPRARSARAGVRVPLAELPPDPALYRANPAASGRVLLGGA